MAKIQKPKGTKGKPTQQTTANLESEELVAMNFKVDKTFRREFRTYASDHDMSMVDLLKKAFEEYKSR
jgi:hypothetical protein